MAQYHIKKWYPRILVFSSGIALVASFWQVVERIHMLKEPAVSLSCNLNPIIDCSGVMAHRLAALFGFPNSMIGMVMFTALLVAGVALYLKTPWSRQFSHVVLGISAVAALFSVWFFAVSLYEIGKVCIFCLAIWPSSMALFWYGLAYWIEQNTPKTDSISLQFVKKYTNELYASTLALMVILYFVRFQEFYFG